MLNITCIQGKVRLLLEQYERVMELSETIFNTLRDGGIEKAENMTRQQLEGVSDLQKTARELQNNIQHICEQNGIKEYKMEALYPFCTVEEQEWFIDQKRKLRAYHDEMVKDMRMNMQLIQAKMVRPSVLVEYYRQQIEERQKRGKKSFSRA